MKQSRGAAALLFLLLILLAMPTTANGQVGKITKAAKKAADKKITQVASDAVRCSLGDKACVEQAKKDGEPVVIVDKDGEPILDDNGNPITDPDKAEARAGKPGEGVWRNYDFVPGRDVWKATDFTDEPIGRFPGSQLEFVKGNMQIVELNGKNVLEVASASVFRVNLPEALPEDYSLEFYLQIGAPNIATTVYFSPMETARSRYDHHYLHLFQRSGIDFQGQHVSQLDGFWSMSQALTPIKFQVDGQNAILYLGTERAALIPNANFGRGNFIEFHVGGNRNLRSYISDITVAVGLDKLYEALMETGEFTTRGILFDFNSDGLRPESTPVLAEILRTLNDHPDLNIVIVGHTDSVGEDDYNQELSERRAASVVNHLVENGIDEARLSSAGRGEAEPVADNDTLEGRQENRRVVIKVAQ